MSNNDQKTVTTTIRGGYAEGTTEYEALGDYESRDVGPEAYQEMAEELNSQQEWENDKARDENYQEEQYRQNELRKEEI